MGTLNFENRPPLQAGLEKLGHKWGWFLALGITISVLGALASSIAYATTVASVMVFGWILLVSGVMFGAFSFLAGKWSGFLLSLGAGVLSVIAGITLLRAPLSGAAVLTLVMASYLLVGGIFRIVAAAVMQFPNWGWSVFSGLVAAGLGAVLLAEWPLVSLWFIGFYVGVDLMVHGVSWCMFALSLHALLSDPDRHEVSRSAA